MLRYALELLTVERKLRSTFLRLSPPPLLYFSSYCSPYTASSAAHRRSWDFPSSSTFRRPIQTRAGAEQGPINKSQVAFATD